MPDAARARRVLILTAAMGGGHVQISHELERRLVGRGHEVVLADLLDLMPSPTGRWLHRLYPWLVNRAPGLYQRIYDVFFLAPQHAGERAGVPVRLSLPGLRRLADRFRPDAVVSTYHLSALAAGRLRARGELACPAVTVITTFAVNSLWLHPAADLEVCISQDAADDAERRTGRPAVVSGPVIRPGFRDGVPDRGEARATLGVPPDGWVALLSTGSIGLAGDVERAARAIAGRPRWTAVVICGHDDALRERLGRVPGVVALGWVEDMPRVMAAADVLVDNAAGMSSKEALGLGLPVVSFRPLAGHGLDDARALARLGLTDLVTEEDALLTALDRLVGDDVRYQERVARGRDLFVADAAELVERVAAAEAPRTA